MKKSTKILAASLAVLPCALVLTACGGGNNEVLKNDYQNATYTATTLADVKQAVAQKTVAFSALKQKANLTFSFDTPSAQAGETTPSTVEISNYAVVSGISANGIEKAEAEIEVKSGDDTSALNAYYKENAIYLDLSDFTLLDDMLPQGSEEMPRKIFYNFDSQQQAAAAAETDQITYDVSDLFTMLESNESFATVLAATTWESVTDGDTYTVKVTFNGEAVTEIITGLAGQYTSGIIGEATEVEKLEVYLVFGATSLEGVAINLEGTVEVNVPMQGQPAPLTLTAGLKLNAEVAVTNEEADLPKGLNDYTDFSPVIDGLLEGYLNA